MDSIPEKAMGPRAIELSTYKIEYLAIVLAMHVHQWRVYLHFSEFAIKSTQIFWFIRKNSEAIPHGSIRPLQNCWVYNITFSSTRH